jgi:hypothetical protein
MANIFGGNTIDNLTITSQLDMSGSKIINLQPYPSYPINDTDAVNKKYVDTLISDIETGSIALNFAQPNYCIFGSNNPDPEHPEQYTGT